MEEFPLYPYSPYGVSKLAAEKLCHAYAENYGIHAVILRYFTVYGERQRPDMGIYKFVKAAFNGEPITIFGDGSQQRDFTYVDDIVNAHLALADTPIDNGVFNISSGEIGHAKVKELLSIIENITGNKIDLEYVEKQKGDVHTTSGSIEKAKKHFGYNPRVSIHEGLERQINWMKKNIVN